MRSPSPAELLDPTLVVTVKVVLSLPSVSCLGIPDASSQVAFGSLVLSLIPRPDSTVPFI